jgi:PPOX class probable F420-dependent enzyme
MLPFELRPEIRELLAGPHTAHLASIRPDGSPMSHPVWVGLDDDGRHLLIGTGRKTGKVRNVEHDPRVSLSIVALDNPYEEAMIRGTVIEVRNDDELIDMDRIARVYTGEDFPFRSGPRVTIVIEPNWADFRILPFEPPSMTPGAGA